MYQNSINIENMRINENTNICTSLKYQLFFHKNRKKCIYIYLTFYKYIIFNCVEIEKIVMKHIMVHHKLKQKNTAKNYLTLFKKNIKINIIK